MQQIHEFRCKCRPMNAATKLFVIIVIFTATLYIFGSLQLRWLYISNIPAHSDEDLFDENMRQKIDEIYHHQLGLPYENESADMGTALLNANGREGHEKLEFSANVVDKIFSQLWPEAEPAPRGSSSTQSHANARETVQPAAAANSTAPPTTDYTVVYEETTESNGTDAFTFPHTEVNAKNFLPTLDVRSKTKRVKITKKTVESTILPEPPRASVQVLNPDQETKNQLREELEKMYKKRRARLRKFCGPRKGWMWLDSMQMLAVPEKDLVVCTVQKAGSTSWHKLVHDLRLPDEQWVGKRKQNWKFATELSELARRKLTHSKKSIRVITVRHPFARLVSAWNNKFHNSFVEQNGDKMLNSMPDLKAYAGKHPTDKDHIIAFEDLAQYIADVGLDSIDVHLKSIEELCSPCVFPYDYVIKSETAPEDSWFITEKINATLSSFSRHVPTLEQPLTVNYGTTAKARHAEEEVVISRLFRKVPRATTRVLMELYSDDFTAFGYSFDVSTLQIGGYE